MDSASVSVELGDDMPSLISVTALPLPLTPAGESLTSSPHSSDILSSSITSFLATTPTRVTRANAHAAAAAVAAARRVSGSSGSATLTDNNQTKRKDKRKRNKEKEKQHEENEENNEHQTFPSIKRQRPDDGDGGVSVPPSDSAWSSLPLHLHHAIFDFLPLGDLSLVACICLSWSRSLHHLPVRCDRIELPRVRLPLLLASFNTTRHITALDIKGEGGIEDALTHESLHLLSIELAHLRALTCVVNVSIDPILHSLPRRFPPLTALQVTLTSQGYDKRDAQRKWRNAWANVRQCLEDVSRIRTLKKLSVDITIPDHEDDASQSDCDSSDDNGDDDAGTRMSASNMPVSVVGSLLPLRSHLTDLTFLCPKGDRVWSAALLTVIRDFSHLTSLCLDRSANWTEDELRILFAHPMAMTQLESFNLASTVIDQTTIQMLRVDTFTQFHPQRIVIEDTRFLSTFTSLTAATLICSRAVDVDQLIASLAHCTRLTELQLCHPLLDDGDLTRLLLPLVRLSSLCLTRMSSLLSLSFASSLAHLSACLTHLRLYRCVGVNPYELYHLKCLRHLHELRLEESLTSVLDPYSLSSFQPESRNFHTQFWPNLKVFIYQTPHKEREQNINDNTNAHTNMNTNTNAITNTPIKSEE